MNYNHFKVITAIIIIVVIFLVFFFIKGYPIIIDNSKSIMDYSQSIKDTSKVVSIKPFEQYNFNKGGWVAYMIINKEDNFQIGCKHIRMYRTDNIKVLNKIKIWEFNVLNSDYGTTNSLFFLYKNDTLLYKSNIILDDYIQGFQNKQMGWMEATKESKMIEVCKEFTPVYTPLIILE